MHVPGPQGCPERVGFLSHESPSQLTSLQLVPRLEAEGQQEATELVPRPQIPAWPCLGLRFGAAQKMAIDLGALRPPPS